jgi:hypothetical protein
MNSRLGRLLVVTTVLTAGTARADDPAISLKNDEAAAVSVSLGTHHGVTLESDFEVIGPQGEVLAIIYPVELFTDRFWSQPLAERVYGRLQVGMRLRSASLDPETHGRVRAQGQTRRRELQAAREWARRDALQDEIDQLRQEKLELLERRDALAEKIFSAEESLIESERRADSVTYSDDDHIDRRLVDLEELTDERDELQSQREVVAEKDPFPDEEIRQLTERIERLNNKIDSERRRIRLSRKRTRSARSTYLSRKAAWKDLIAERNALTTKIRFLTERIQTLSERVE